MMKEDRGGKQLNSLSSALDIAQRDRSLVEDVTTFLAQPKDASKEIMSIEKSHIRIPDELVIQCGGEVIRFPRIEPAIHSPYSLESLRSDWPTIGEDILPRWQIGDIPVLFFAGLVGAWSSSALTEKFGDLHDGPLSKQHAREIVDHVPGEGVGGWFHRLKYGHDLFNPFEVDWSNYAADKNLVGVASALWPWLKHLLQDTFSREGLPFPGSSLLREFILNHMDYDTYKELLTIKARDLAGAALTTALMEAYVALSTKVVGQKPTLRSYRRYSLVAGAHLVSVGTGLLMPIPSFNYGSATQAGYYGFKLMSLIRDVDRILFNRDGILAERAGSLATNDRQLNASNLILEDHLAGLDAFTRNLDKAMEEARANTSLFPEPMRMCSVGLDEDTRFLEMLNSTMGKLRPITSSVGGDK